MTKQELYRDLCLEAGTYDAKYSGSADEFYADCSHNIHADLDGAMRFAAAGDMICLGGVRVEIGLPRFLANWIGGSDGNGEYVVPSMGWHSADGDNWTDAHGHPVDSNIFHQNSIALSGGPRNLQRVG